MYWLRFWLSFVGCSLDVLRSGVFLLCAVAFCGVACMVCWVCGDVNCVVHWSGVILFMERCALCLAVLCGVMCIVFGVCCGVVPCGIVRLCVLSCVLCFALSCVWRVLRCSVYCILWFVA